MKSPDEKPLNRKRKISTLRYYAEDHDRWAAVLDTIAPEAKNQGDRTAQLLHWIEAQLQKNSTDPLPEVVQESIPPIEPEPTKQEPESEPKQEKEETPLLDPTVQLLVSHMAQVMESVAGLTDALTGQRQAAPAAAPLPRKSAPTIQTPAEERVSPAARPRATGGKSREIINAAIDAIMAHNNTPDRLYDQKWAISINALKEFSRSQYTIQQVLSERRDEIGAHHEQHQMDAVKHNHKHKGKHKITDVIILDMESQLD